MTCIIRAIAKFPCPTCGVTRALLAFLRGDFASYKFYNAFAIPLFAAAVAMILGSRTKKRTLQIFSAAILILNIPYYFFRVKFNLIP